MKHSTGLQVKKSSFVPTNQQTTPFPPIPSAIDTAPLPAGLRVAPFFTSRPILRLRSKRSKSITLLTYMALQTKERAALKRQKRPSAENANDASRTSTVSIRSITAALAPSVGLQMGKPSPRRDPAEGKIWKSNGHRHFGWSYSVSPTLLGTCEPGSQAGF